MIYAYLEYIELNLVEAFSYFDININSFELIRA